MSMLSKYYHEVKLTKDIVQRKIKYFINILKQLSTLLQVNNFKTKISLMY